MGVNSVLGSALSGLIASQAGMRTTSNNIANVNTPGYAREQIGLSPRVLGGVGSGVTTDDVRRVTDAFLVAASLNATSKAAGAEAARDLLDRVQAAYGDPSSGTSVFSNINDLFAGFTEAATDPANPVRRTASIDDLRATLQDFDRLASQIQSTRAEADGRITDAVAKINDLLADVGRLNTEIGRSNALGSASGAENALAPVLDELSSLIDIRTIKQSSGAVEVRTQDGLLLVGATVATLSYASVGVAAPGDTHPAIMVQHGSAPAQELNPHIRGGELRGLLDVRDKELPQAASILGEFAAKTADELNRAHNQNASYPPVQTLQGRDTALLGTDQHNFTGSTTLSVLGSDGSLQSTIELDFDAGTINVDGGGAVAIGGTTVADVVGAINGALGAGSATFTNGVLTLDAGAGRGIAFTEGAPPSDRGGRTFAHYFGVNDLVTAAHPLFYETGFAAGDAHGFGGGEAFTLRLEDANGATLTDATVTITAGQNFSDIIADLNDVTTGLGAYGTFGLTVPDGELQFTPGGNYLGSQIKVLDDNTQRGGSSRTFTQLFGVGEGTRSARAYGLEVRPDIEADVSRLSLGRVDLTGMALGDIVTGSGDGSGASALHAAGSTNASFAAAGGMFAVATTVLDYAGRVAGDMGRRANNAERVATSAATIKDEAADRRASAEGVNIDEELVKLTTFQQSFNAASRLIQAAKEMSDTLLSIV